MMFNWGSFSEKQINSILNADKRINIWQGSVRSGKTIASIVRWLEFLQTGPEGKKLMIGKTQRTLKRNILDVIQDMVGRENFYFNRGLGEVQIYDKKLYIAGANDARAEDKIRGMTLAGAYCDEVSIYPEGFFQMLLSRLSVKGAKVFLTTNPEGPYHWLKNYYIDREDELDLNNFHFTLEDNLTLDPEYIKQLKKEYTGVWYDRYILGKWTLAEGLIYNMFDKETHVVDEIPQIRRYWVGVDYGTSNPTAFVLIGEADGKLYIVDEFKHSGGDMQSSKTDEEYTDELINWLGDIVPQRIAVDPSAKSFRLQLFRSKSQCPALSKTIAANNDVLDGIRTVSSLMSAGKLKIHRRCKEVQKELTLYSWDSKAQEKGEDKPLKEHDHLMDALRYGIMSAGTTVNRLLGSR